MIETKHYLEATAPCKHEAPTAEPQTTQEEEEQRLQRNAAEEARLDLVAGTQGPAGALNSLQGPAH